MENFKRFSEEWKEFEIAGQRETRYAVSNYGGFRSFTDTIENGRDLKGSITEGFQFLRYKRLENNVMNYHHYAIHKVIAELFIPKTSEEQTHVLHLNYNKLDNHLNNLKWATYDEMIAHGKKSPAVIEAKKKFREFNIKRDGAKLTSTEVIRLKRRILDPNRKTRLRLIAKEFGISEMQLHRIKTGENWGHIKVEIPNKTS
ncbi:NUMOD4 domain-containing protein [uncultured Flavobacterium sp.]|uniref:NUMOD4 domain-containing protein n=1 Tax=uncultured Flavobacterium sp. TaxID=165435 RepID=UPI0030EFA56A|tara:strand:+ start:20119 stop:20721 length:603 start_codon:yes stop_codon:yes gene_type:complete